MKLTGAAGEQIAADYLADRGHNIITRNFHSRYGEIDIISRAGEIIVFTEVKTRKDASFASALEAVSPSKIKKLRSTALSYLQQSGWDGTVRFDVIEVYAAPKPPGYKINHIEEAF